MKEIKALKLHDSTRVGRMLIVRVVGGIIYEVQIYGMDEYIVSSSSVFVPFTDFNESDTRLIALADEEV